MISSAMMLLSIDSAFGLVAGMDGLSRRSIYEGSRTVAPSMAAQVRSPRVQNISKLPASLLARVRARCRGAAHR